MRGNLWIFLAGTLIASSAGAQHATSQAASAQPRARGTSDTDKLEAAADNIARMKNALKQVLGRAEQARNEKDVVKLNCINEKLTQIKSLIKVAEQADIALHESIATKDGGGETDFSKIAIARTKVDGLRADSEQCVGQLAYMVDEKTTVEVEMPAGLQSGTHESDLGVARRDDDRLKALPPLEAINDLFGPATTIRPPPVGP